MAVLDKEPSQIGTSQSSNQAATLNDSDKPSVKTKHETEPFTEPIVEERSSNLEDPEQVNAIYHYLLIVADKNCPDKDRAAAAEHLAIHYFKRPIYPVYWNTNQARICREIKETGLGIIRRTRTCLFESIGVLEPWQSKKEAVEAVRNKLSILMLVDLLGEGWRNKPHRSEITGLGIGEGRDLSTVDFILNETYGDNDPGRFAIQSTDKAITEGATGVQVNDTPCRDTFGLDEQSCEGKDLSLIMEEITQRIGDGEEPEEVLGVKEDKDTVEWRKAGAEYHRGVVSIDGRPSEEWADLIDLGRQRRVLTELEPEIFLNKIIDKANLSAFQMDVILAIKGGMRATEFAKLHNIKSTRVRKAHQRAREKMKETAEKLEKKVK